ncbi:MAG: tetratricopeptide repeat protein [Bacteroidales bacterium]|nr:tetratricopeptide repeat protein [Bacteroidales bacterium]
MKKFAMLFLLFIPTWLMAQSADELLEKGKNAERLALNRRATEYYLQATQAAPEQANAWLCLGMLLQRLSHYSEAIPALAKAATLADSAADSVAALANEHLAECYVDDGDFDGAKNGGIGDSSDLIGIVERAIELNPQSASAHASMALILNHQRQFMPALSWVKKAVELGGNNPRAYNAYGIVLYNQGRDNDAIKQFKMALKTDPDNDDAFYNLGVMHALRGNHETALKYLREGLKQNPNSVKLYYFMGVANLDRGNAEQAIKCYEHIIQNLDSTYTPAYNKLGAIYWKKGDFDRAVGYHNQAVKINPKDAESYKCLGKVYVDKGDFVKATRNYQKAVLNNPRDHETYLLMAKLYAAQGNEGREASSYKKAAKLGNAEAQAWMVKRGKKW